MGFFGTKSEDEVKKDSISTIEPQLPKEEHSIVKKPLANVSVLNNHIKSRADIEGGGSLVIGGKYEGSVKIEETFMLEKGATFNGKVKAKNVKIAGEFTGEIEASVVEVSSSSKFTGIISSNKAFLAGVINGVVNSKDSIEVLVSGNIETKEFKSANIKISGEIRGNIIASTLLEVTKDGSVNGEIVTKGIKTEQGGTIIGNIQTYDESLHGIDVAYSLDDIGVESSNKENKLESVEKKLESVDIEKYAKKEEKTPKRI